MNRILDTVQGHIYIGENVDNCLHHMQHHLWKPLSRTSTVEIDSERTYVW